MTTKARAAAVTVTRRIGRRACCWNDTEEQIWYVTVYVPAALAGTTIAVRALTVSPVRTRLAQ